MPSRLSKPVRWSAVVLALMILGALTTLGVAWWCSYRAEGIEGNTRVYGGRVNTVRWTNDSGRDAAATIHQYRWRGLAYVRFFRRDPADRYTLIDGPVADVVPAWAAPIMPRLLERLPAVPRGEHMWNTDRQEPDLLIAAGWPLPAFVCHARSMPAYDLAAEPGDADWIGSGVDHVISGGFSMPRGMRKADEGSALMQPPGLLVPLPYRPLWRGLLLNTGLYMVVWCVLLALGTVPFAVRRAIRRRRNGCARCGYDLRGLVSGAACPECGTGRVSAAASPVPPQ